jgi:hypothetical protein
MGWLVEERLGSSVTKGDGAGKRTRRHSIGFTRFRAEEETMSTFERKVAHLTVPRRTLLKMASAGMASAVASRALFKGMEAAAQGTPGGTLNIGKPYELSGYDPHPEGNQTSW